MKALPADVEKTRAKMQFIRVQSDNCKGCLQCQMICSLTYTNRINPAAAHIRVERGSPDFYHYAVGFTAGCRDNCRLCATVCPYQCLTRAGREEGSDG